MVYRDFSFLCKIIIVHNYKSDLWIYNNWISYCMLWCHNKSIMKWVIKYNANWSKPFTRKKLFSWCKAENIYVNFISIFSISLSTNIMLVTDSTRVVYIYNFILKMWYSQEELHIEVAKFETCVKFKDKAYNRRAFNNRIYLIKLFSIMERNYIFKFQTNLFYIGSKPRNECCCACDK